MSHLPTVIYLDSAHELGETLHELWVAWNTLPAEGGIIWGDDWTWMAVGHDVGLFASCMGSSRESKAWADLLARELDAPQLRGPCLPYGSMQQFHSMPETKFQGLGPGTTARLCSTNAGGGGEVLVYQGQWIMIKGPNQPKSELGACSAIASKAFKDAVDANAFG